MLRNLKKLQRITLNNNPLKCGTNFNSIKNIHQIQHLQQLNCLNADAKMEVKEYSDFAIMSLCYFPREEVEQEWKKTCR